MRCELAAEPASGPACDHAALSNPARTRAQAEAEVDILKKEIEGIIDTKDAAADYAKAKGEDGGDGLSFFESANAFRKAKQRSDKVT